MEKMHRVVEIEKYRETGEDTELDTGDDAVQNLDVGGNKDPLTKDLAALYDDAAHQKNPLSDTLRARRERGLKLFDYLTPKLKFCQRPKPKIAPSRSIPAICAPFPAVCTKKAPPHARQRLCFGSQSSIKRSSLRPSLA